MINDYISLNYCYKIDGEIYRKLDFELEFSLNVYLTNSLINQLRIEFDNDLTSALINVME